MKLIEIAVEYHDELNKKLWKDNKLIPEVREALIKIAKKFVEFIDIDNSFIEDVIITGSNCNYNWTSHSDLDLHIVVDYKKFQSSCEAANVEEVFNTKKSVWNDEHEISIYGIPVELYIQDSAGNDSADRVIYSIIDDEWLEPPHKLNDIKIDTQLVDGKYKFLKKEIESILNKKVDDVAVIDELKDKIAKMRRSGLAKSGEFSVENIVYKKLRNAGLLDKLYAHSGKVEDEDLSLKK